MRTPAEVIQLALNHPEGYDLESEVDDGRKKYMCFVLRDMHSLDIITKEEMVSAIDSFGTILLASNNISLGGYLSKSMGNKITCREEMDQAKLNFWQKFISDNS